MIVKLKEYLSAFSAQSPLVNSFNLLSLDNVAAKKGNEYPMVILENNFNSIIDNTRRHWVGTFYISVLDQPARQALLEDKWVTLDQLFTVVDDLRFLLTKEFALIDINVISVDNLLVDNTIGYRLECNLPIFTRSCPSFNFEKPTTSCY